ncbi:MAG TPA: DUF6325 family protein [Gaiellaceae bacterium]|nr:DUF6325 family protein [Gaiellaceae bacterium]
MSPAEGTEQSLPFGPVQMLVLEFDSENLKGEILPEMRRLKDAGIVRLIDLLVVQKQENGDVVTVQDTDLSQEEAMEFGAIAGALIGLGAGGEEGAEAGAIAGAEALEDTHVFDEDQALVLEDTLPPGTTAAVALIEHLWAIPLRDKIVEAGGVALADIWVHPSDLIATGLVAAIAAQDA